MIKRFIFVLCFYPFLLAAFILGGLLGIPALFVWCITGELPEWPMVGMEAFGKFESWAGV